MKFRLLVTGLILLSAAGVINARTTWAQNERNQDLSIAAELDALTVAITKMTTLLEREQIQEQDRLHLAKLSKAIDYLNFRSRRIETLERDLASLRLARLGQEDTLKIWEDRQRECDEFTKTKSAPNPELENSCKRFINQQKLVKAQTARMNDEIIMLENRLYELQNELADVESYVQKNLGDIK